MLISTATRLADALWISRERVPARYQHPFGTDPKPQRSACCQLGLCAERAVTLPECYIDWRTAARFRAATGEQAAEAGYADGLLGGADALDHSEALGFEFRDGDFLHGFSLWSF